METLKAFPKYYTHESEDMKRSQHKELVAYKQNDEWTSQIIQIAAEAQNMVVFATHQS